MLTSLSAPRCVSFVLAPAAVLVAAISLTGCATKPAATDAAASLPRIACVFEPTGPAAVLDVAALQGAMLAREEAGTVPWGVDIVSVAGAEQAAKTAIAALGTSDSDELRAGFAPFAAAKTPFLVVGATDPCLARLPSGDLLSFACYSDSAQGAAMAEFAHGQLGARKIAILFEATSDFPVAVSQAFAARARGLEGVQVTTIAFTDAMKIDPKAVLAGASKLDAVYIACNATSVVPAIETLRNAGFQGAILGADSFDIPDVDAASKQGAVYFSTHAWFGTGASAAAQRFAEKYRAQFKTEPTAFSALGYDAMQAMVRAMQSLPPDRRTREGVAGALRALAPHAGITGEIAFPSPGYFAAKPVWIVTVEAGSRVRAKHFSPSRIPEPNCAR